MATPISPEDLPPAARAVDELTKAYGADFVLGAVRLADAPEAEYRARRREYVDMLTGRALLPDGTHATPDRLRVLTLQFELVEALSRLRKKGLA